MPALPRRLLAVVATVAVVWFLRASAPVTLPLAVALVLVVLLDPVRAWLARRVPGAVAVAGAFALAVGALGVFGWALGEAASSAVDGFREYRPEAERALARLGGLPLAGDIGSGAAGGAAGAAFGGAWRLAGAVVLVYALLALALAEAPEWGRKLGDRFGRPAARTAADAGRRIVSQVQRFVAVQAFTSVATGVLTGLACWALGIDLALVWGGLAGVLNFVPTLGSVVGVVPPVAFAALQHGLDWHAPVLLAVLAVVQLGLGAWLDPRLQGRALRLSPLVVLVAIAFWGWLWGIAGAFVAVPVTAAAVVACAEFEPTRWVADLLTRDRAGSDGQSGADGPTADGPAGDGAARGAGRSARAAG